jgi:hypothetical protein
MDVHGGVDAENRNIIVWNKHGRINQQFDVVYRTEWEEEPTKGQLNIRFGLYVERSFYIISRMTSGRYLDLINNRNMVIKTQNGRKTQEWYFDQRSLTIKTRLNNQSWDIQSAGRTRNMQVWSTNSGWFQIFMYRRQNFVNIQSKKVLDVTGNRDQEGQPVIVWKRHNGWNQRWRVVYVDKAKKIPGKGWDGAFGFHINRPFYIRSRMPMKRVAECISANNVVIKRWAKGRTAQLFFFDSVSKTIKSQQWKHVSLDISGNGSSSNLRMTTTNSRWW